MANDLIQIPPDSTGKKVATKTFLIDAETVHVQSVLLAGGNEPENSQYVDARGAAYIRFSEGEPTLDPYANLKMARNYALGIYDHSGASQDDLYTIKEENGGSSVYDADQCRMILRCDTTDIAIVQRTTNRYHFSTYGTGLLCVFNVQCGDTGKTNNIRRWGYYDDLNGCFFELKGTTLYAVSRSNGVDDPTAQSAWNKDVVDGTGTSSYNLSLTNKETYWINIRWPGSVIFGVFSDEGLRIVCHIFGSTRDQLQNSSLPVRVENFNTDITLSTAELFEYAMAVYSDNIVEYTFWRYADIETSAGVVVTDKTPIISIRSKLLVNGVVNRTTIYPQTLSVYTDQPLSICLVWSGTLSGDTWNISGESTAEGDTTATSIAYGGSNGEGYDFVSEYCGTGVTNIDLSKYFEINDEGVCLLSDGSESYVLSFIGCRLTNSTTTVKCKLTYKELR